MCDMLIAAIHLAALLVLCTGPFNHFVYYFYSFRLRGTPLEPKLQVYIDSVPSLRERICFELAGMGTDREDEPTSALEIETCLWNLGCLLTLSRKLTLTSSHILMSRLQSITYDFKAACRYLFLTSPHSIRYVYMLCSLSNAGTLPNNIVSNVNLPSNK